MCEINGAYRRVYRLEVFSAPLSVVNGVQKFSEEDFIKQISEKLVLAEMELNKDGRFRFHIHEE
jgi:hypothetical protein